MTSWVDSHCHLPEDAAEAAAVVAEARDHGVTKLITVGCDRGSSLVARAHAERFPGVHHTVGLHPHEARFGVGSVGDLFDAGDGPAPVAVGECGLDYHYDHSPRDDQRTAFAEQIAIAHRLDLPLVIHTREAWDDTFDILDVQGVPARTIFHCFTGGPDEVRRCLDRGAYVSFAGIVTFKGASEVAEAAVLVPPERLLVETDSPYLAPAPHRGRRNRPAWVTAVGSFLAALRGVPVDELRDTTRTNTQHAFALDD